MQNAELKDSVLSRPRLSPLRALLWKEWRQQRRIFLPLFALAYVLGISGQFVGQTETPLTSLGLRTVFLAIVILIGAVGTLVLSANAFCAERDENTEQFLEMIPCSRSKIFWVKLGFVLLLVLIGLMPAGAWAFFSALAGGVHSTDLWPGAVAVAFGAVLLAIVPALIASFGLSVIGTIVASIAVALGCAAWAPYSFKAWSLFVPICAPASFVILQGFGQSLMLATLLFASHWLWVRTERTWRSSARTLAAAAGLLLAFAAVPVGVWVYVTCIAPLSFFLGGWPAPPWWGGASAVRISSASANGKYATFEATYYGWGEVGDGSRCALVDVTSGRYRWLTRFRPSFASGWNPSGTAFVLVEADELLWPFRSWADYQGKEMCFVVDAWSGAIQSFEDLCPELPRMAHWGHMRRVGWYGDNVFVFRDGGDVLFADIEHHQVRRCRMPAVFRGAELDPMSLTQRGVFTAPREPEGRELRVLRFAPELPQAESLVLKGSPYAPEEIKASADGRWLLLSSRDRSYFYWHLAPAENEAMCRLLLSNDPESKGLISADWQVDGFVPGSHQVLLRSRTELALFDADGTVFRAVHLEGIEGRRIRWVEPSREGGLVLLELLNPGTEAFSYIVVDLRHRTSPIVFDWPYVRWLGEDRLVARKGSRVWVMNRDGTGKRPLVLR